MSELPLGEPWMSGAVLSESVDGAEPIYRYLLWRRWDRSKPILVLTMFNPSTANDRDNDATVRSCIRLAKALGFGGIRIVNLFAVRSRDPNAVVAHADPVGPQNDDVLRHAYQDADLVVVAWGALVEKLPPDLIARRVAQINQLIFDAGRRSYCLGRTGGGHPKHPLFLASTTPLEVFQEGPT